jgi:trimethylamine--corrinoid protein Co-methyltransferase
MPPKKNRAQESFSFPRLSDEQCGTIHEACLDILERIGVRLELPEAVELLKKAGAQVIDGNRVHIPPKLVEKALATTPRQVTLYDRNGNPAMEVEGHRCFYGPGSDCLHIIDFRDGKRRDPGIQDVISGTILCDYLTNIDFVMSMVLPKDVNPTTADRYQMAGCLDAVQMAEEVAGGPEALRKRPTVACYINAVSGLLHNKEALEKLLYLASKNLPCLYLPSSTAAVTSPVTPAGNVALDFAGVLTGLVLSQLKTEGTPVIVSGMPPGGTLDMRTLVTSYCEPERTILQAVSHFHDLPMFSIAGATEAKTVDSQAAAEAAMSLVVETLAGGNIIHDLGYMESGLTYSFVQLFLCDEIVSWIKGFLKEFEVSDETLALDVIAEVGPEGQYLKTTHTLKHYKERWYPNFFERMNYESWLAKGGKDFSERTSEKIEAILAEHKPEPLQPEVKKRLAEIVRKAETK